MRNWYTFGAFGDHVYELGWRQMLQLLLGNDVKLDGSSVVISWGKSQATTLYDAPSREEQLFGA